MCMKTESVYVTVKIDIECPSDMTYSEVEELVNDMGYNFSIPVYHESKVIDMEICGVNEYNCYEKPACNRQLDNTQ